MIKVLFIFLSIFCSYCSYSNSKQNEKRIQLLEQRIKQIKHKIEVIKIKPQKTDFWEIDYIRHHKPDMDATFLWSSMNEENYLTLHGLVQMNQDIFSDTQGLLFNDGRSSQPINFKNTVDRFWLNRASPIFEATVKNAFHLFLIPDFGREQIRLFDGLIDVNYFRILGLQVGFQRSLVVGIQNLQPEEYWFTNYPGFSTGMAPNREIGVMLHGSIGPYRPAEYKYGSHLGFNDWLSYQVGLFSGAADGENPGLNPVGETTLTYSSQPLTLSNKAFEGRVFFNPFLNQNYPVLKYLSLGFASSVQTNNNQGNLPDMLSIGQNPIFSYNKIFANGNRTRLHPQLFYHYGPFGLLTDWAQTLQHLSNSNTPDTFLVKNTTTKQINKAAEIQFVVNLTGEELDFIQFTPNQPFHFFEKDGLGGWQLMLRLTNLWMDPSVFSQYEDYTKDNQIYRSYLFSDPRTSVQSAKAWGINLLWYWNQNFRISSEYSQTAYMGGCSTGAYLDPIHPGCLTASNYYIENITSQVINRPSEKVFMQRFQFIF